jgi:hypothetical protein
VVDCEFVSDVLVQDFHAAIHFGSTITF